MCIISNFTNFILSQTTIIYVVNQRGEESCCDTWCYFKIPHNSGDQYHPHFSLIYIFFRWETDGCLSVRCQWNIFELISKSLLFLKKTTFLSVGIGSDFREVSISDCRDNYYRLKHRPISHPLFSRGIIIRNNPQFCPLE